MRGVDPRLEKYDEPATRDPNRWIVKHPIRAPIIGLAVAAVLFLVRLYHFAILFLLFSILLLIYGLVRKAVYIAEERKAERRRVESNREKPDLSRFFKK